MKVRRGIENGVGWWDGMEVTTLLFTFTFLLFSFDVLIAWSGQGFGYFLLLRN